MEKIRWTNSEIRKLFRMELRYKSIQTLYNAEDREEIPKADREARGKVWKRVWSLDQLPEIGKRFGFLKKPKAQKILCTYQQKGGVYKTTTTYNLGRVLALNGSKVLFIGLDSECSLTDIIIPQQQLARLDDAKEIPGLYHFFCENIPLSKIIQKTSLPTLDFIPETYQLVKLNKWLSDEKRREYIFQDRLLASLSSYDVIIFDNGPTWNYLVENSLLVSAVVRMPMGCNLLSYNASATNMQNLYDFQNIMKLNKQEIIMFSTALERNSLSQQINATYLSKYPDNMLTVPIRKSVKWEEALMSKQSIIEYSSESQAAIEYYQLIADEWLRINGKSVEYIGIELGHELETN